MLKRPCRASAFWAGYGQTFLRNIRLLVSGLEGRFLSERSAGEEVSQLLFAARECCRDQLYVPAASFGIDSAELDRDDAPRLRFCAEGAHADHARPKAEAV